MATLHKVLFGTLLVVIGTPLTFLHWLFGGKDFSHGKAVVFVVMMFLFGSVFFFK
jgi:hypothetical protein